MPHALNSLIAGALALAVLAPAAGDTAVIGASRDNTLYQSPLGNISNGAGVFFFAGKTAGAVVHRGVIAFDVAAAIPAGSTITKATLTLHMSKSQVGGNTVSVHRLLADWGEGGSDAPLEEGQGAPAQPGDATWLHRFYDTEVWANPGGDYAAAPSAAGVVGGVGFYDWESAALAADVQGWLDEPGGAHGWIVIGKEDFNGASKRFDSRESETPRNRPVLTIEFDPPPCYPDCEQDGDLDIDDFICFQTLFALEAPAADCDGDSLLTIDDFICFQTFFAVGCP